MLTALKETCSPTSLHSFIASKAIFGYSATMQREQRPRANAPINSGETEGVRWFVGFQERSFSVTTAPFFTRPSAWSRGFYRKKSERKRDWKRGHSSTLSTIRSAHYQNFETFCRLFCKNNRWMMKTGGLSSVRILLSFVPFSNFHFSDPWGA